MGIKQIEQYKLIGKIAEGGIGIVYKAMDTTKKTIVAIKTLKEEVNTRNEAFLRFKKEAKVLENLNQNNVLKFIDFIEKDSKVYIVTEFIFGKTLKKVIKDKSLKNDEKIDVIIQLARALDYVHSQGIIHQDIKPSNIMISRENEVKILDFGVARLLDMQKMFTNKDSVEGSFAYMSPEQSGILKRNIDNRADLYSLGILFYELITGELPYKAKDVGELLHQHIARIPAAPQSLVPNLSAIINKIILKLIKKDPSDRYQTAFGLAEDLEIYKKLTEEQKKTFYLELGKKDRLKNLNYRTGFVGRKKDLENLLNHLNETILNKGHISFIIGKSGSGKSRLAVELQNYTAAKNAFFVESISTQEGVNKPYWPFIESIEKLISVIDKLSAQHKDDTYKRIKERLGQEGVILSKVAPKLVPILGGFDKAVKFSTNEDELFLEKLRDFYLAIASPTHPLVLVFDDVHFWDQGSIQFFNFFKNSVANSSLFVMLIFREEEISRNHEFYQEIIESAKEGTVGIVSLPNLTYDEVDELTLSIFGTVYNGIHELTARLYESTQGNPLLIIENIKTFVEEQIIVQKKDGWIIDLDQLSEFRVSSSITDKMLSRLDKITTTTREILNYAAILGKNFSFDILHQMASTFKEHFSKELLLDCLQEAAESGLIDETLSQYGETLYSFRHDKINESIIGHIADGKRKSIHRVAAGIIESNYTEDDKIYKLAYHYLMADEMEKAYEYNENAGIKALEIYSLKLAVSFFNDALRALKNINDRTSRIVDMTLQIVELNIHLSEFQKNIVLLEDIMALAEGLNDKTKVVKIYFLLGRSYYFMGQQFKAMPYLEKAIPIAESLEMHDLLAIAYCALGRANSFRSYFKEGIESMRRGLSLLPENDKGHMVELERIGAMGILSQMLGYCGRRKDVIEVIDELHRRYGATDNEIFKLYVQFYTCSGYALAGLTNKALEESQKSYKMARDYKNMTVEIYSSFFLGKAYASMGDFENAIKATTKTINLGNEHNITIGFHVVHFFLIEYYLIIGNIQVAKELFKEVEIYLKDLSQDYVQYWKLRLHATFELFSHVTNFTKALRLIDKTIDIATSMGEYYDYYRAQSILIKALMHEKMDSSEEGRQLFDEAVAIFGKLEMESDIGKATMLFNKFSIIKKELNKRLNDEDGTFTSTTDTQEVFSQQRYLKYLLKLAEQLSQVLEMDALLEKIMSLAIEVSGAERGILFLYKNANEPNSELLMQAIKSIEQDEENREMHYSRVVLEKTLKSGKGQLIIDAEKELAEDKTVVTYKMKSIITAPVVTAGKTLGTLYLDNRQVKGLFTQDNFELLKAFAIEAAISIENAKLYEQVHEKALIEQEMAIARRIQTVLLPKNPTIQGYVISGYMEPADEVGGDYYDVINVAGRDWIIIGDVSGHGLTAGLIMMMVQTAIHAILCQNPDLTPAQLLISINETIAYNIRKLGENKYMTATVLASFKNGEFHFSGLHQDILIYRAEKNIIEAVDTVGMWLGVVDDLEGMVYNDKFTLQTGDICLLYTDGVTEATDEHGKMFSYDGLKDAFLTLADKDPHDIKNGIIGKLKNYKKEDDITLMVIKRQE